jgi:hypothetical protein
LIGGQQSDRDRIDRRPSKGFAIDILWPATLSLSLGHSGVKKDRLATAIRGGEEGKSHICWTVRKSYKLQGQ